MLVLCHRASNAATLLVDTVALTRLLGLIRLGRIAANSGSERGDALDQLALSAPSRRVVVVPADQDVGWILLGDDALWRVVRVAVALGVAEPRGAAIAAVAQRGWHRTGSSGPDILLRRIDGCHDRVRLRRECEMDGCL